VNRFAVTGLVLAFVVAPACATGRKGPEPVTDAAAVSSTRPVGNDVAAATFIAAWSRGDTDAMRQIADGAVVEVALGLGRAQGSPECSSQRSGQYQCIVTMSTSKRAYILVGEPGAPPGRVWWASEYHPYSWPRSDERSGPQTNRVGCHP
jgi:hypothetical protein